MNQTALLPNLAYQKPKHPSFQDTAPAAGRASDISFSIEEKRRLDISSRLISG